LLLLPEALLSSQKERRESSAEVENIQHATEKGLVDPILAKTYAALFRHHGGREKTETRGIRAVSGTGTRARGFS